MWAPVCFWGKHYNAFFKGKAEILLSTASTNASTLASTSHHAPTLQLMPKLKDLVNECMALHRKSSKANRWQDVYGTLGRLLSMSEQGLAEVK